ncbi:hypothetical protein TNCV_3627541 [Trichonephila clavipes]|nr:hypothetical protein TNCV_3627541 [Trichonephila clavipes]
MLIGRTIEFSQCGRPRWHRIRVITGEALPPLALGDNRPTRLNPSPKRPRVHHLETITCLVTFTLKVSLSRPAHIALYSSCLRPRCVRGTQHKADCSLKFPSNRALRLTIFCMSRKEKVW